MRYKFCPECGMELTLKEAGDDGMVPYCEKCDHYWFDSFPSCVIALIYNEEGELVIIRQNYLSDKYFGYVAGYMKPGETAEESVVREIEEEVGLKVEDLKYGGTYWFTPGGQLMHGFLAGVKKDELKFSDEVDAGMWVTPEEIHSYIFPEHPGSALRPLLKRYLEMKGKETLKN